MNNKETTKNIFDSTIKKQNQPEYSQVIKTNNKNSPQHIEPGRSNLNPLLNLRSNQNIFSSKIDFTKLNYNQTYQKYSQALLFQRIQDNEKKRMASLQFLSDLNKEEKVPQNEKEIKSKSRIDILGFKHPLEKPSLKSRHVFPKPSSNDLLSNQIQKYKMQYYINQNQSKKF